MSEKIVFNGNKHKEVSIDFYRDEQSGRVVVDIDTNGVSDQNELAILLHFTLTKMLENRENAEKASPSNS